MLLFWKTFVRPGVSHPHSSAASYGSWVAIAATLVSVGVLSKGQRLRRSKDDPKSTWGAWTWVEPLRYVYIIYVYTHTYMYIHTTFAISNIYSIYIFCIYTYIYICVHHVPGTLAFTCFFFGDGNSPVTVELPGKASDRRSRIGLAAKGFATAASWLPGFMSRVWAWRSFNRMWEKYVQ